MPRRFAKHSAPRCALCPVFRDPIITDPSGRRLCHEHGVAAGLLAPLPAAPAIAKVEPPAEDCCHSCGEAAPPPPAGLRLRWCASCARSMAS
jgi:hypothetical protein